MSNQTRKIIHIDMDCFYAAVEIRDNPALSNFPVAVGGAAEDRSVLCTCNYLARKWQVRSGMATAYAKRICPDLIVLPVNMEKYQNVAHEIRRIFFEFTTLVEPLSLDEAYLDVTQCSDYRGSATLIAQAIREKIERTTQLTASAGVSTNKLLAKIASGWNKPNGLFVIPPTQIDAFIEKLSVTELFGVGKVTAQKLHQLNLHTCKDLQHVSLADLTMHFSGKSALRLYAQCRGIDDRPVEPNRLRQSIAVEQTFKKDIDLDEHCLMILRELFASLQQRMNKYAVERSVKNQFIKIKLAHFKLITLERSSVTMDFSLYQQLLFEMIQRGYGKIRLMGIGVHLKK